MMPDADKIVEIQNGFNAAFINQTFQSNEGVKILVSMESKSF